MPKPKITKLDDFIRGDTPLFVFNATIDGEAFDVTDWTGLFTLTANTSPSSNSDAIIPAAAMIKDEVNNTFSYQLTHTLSKTLTPGTTYYGDVQVQKDPSESNTFTIVRFSVATATDYGI